MKPGWGVVTCALLLVWSRYCQAGGLPVYDAIADVKTTIGSVLRGAEAARAYSQQVQQYAQDAQSLVQMVKTAEAMGKSIANLPATGNPLEVLAFVEGHTSQVLGTAQAIGFALDKTTAQFDTLYRQAAQVTTPAGRAQMLERMQAARLDMAGVAMQAQSIQHTFTGIFARLATLMGLQPPGTTAAVEALTRQQVLAQQQAAVGLTIHALTARLEAMQQAEALVVHQLDCLAAAHETHRASLGTWQEGPPLAFTSRGTWR